MDAVKCEVCETVQQPASICIGCGMPLHLPAGVEPVGDLPIERVPGLEITSLDDTGEVALDVMPDIEVTIQPPAEEVTPEQIPDYEVAAASPVIDLFGAEDPLPDLEEAVAPFEKLPPGEAYPRLCPHCGFEQEQGRICNNCGRARVNPKPPARETTDKVRCPGCGSIVLQAEVCSDCGSPLPVVKE